MTSGLPSGITNNEAVSVMSDVSGGLADTPTEPTHRLEVGSEGSLTVTCLAPIGAWCRMHCPMSCDEWGPEHGQEYGPLHDLIDYGQCLAVEWLEATDYAGYEGYGDDDTSFRSGPVRVFYDHGWLFEPIKSEVSPS